MIPDSFIKQMQSMLGDAEARELLNAIDTPSPTSIRLNPKKWKKTDAEEWLHQMGAQPVPWCRDSFYLENRPSFTADPRFHAGAYYVQEASSMFVDHIIRQVIPSDVPVCALDLCAAPGGKSTLLLSAMPEGSVLIANEIIRQRCHILAENLTKWGNPNIIVTNNDSADFQALQQCFDLILCDVPCSGEGMFRKDPRSIDEWSLQNVEMCSQRQQTIVSNIWPCLKPGGILIYSTCTYNTQENEENVDWLIRRTGAEPIAVSTSPEWKIKGNLLKDSNFPCYHFMPHRTCGEGFFVAVLRKGEEPVVRKATKPEKRSSKAKASQPLKGLLHLEDFFIEQSAKDNVFYAFPLVHATLLSQARRHLNIVHYGISMAVHKGKDTLQPLQSLAMSNELDTSIFTIASLTKDAALDYLSCRSLTLPNETPRGYVLVCYDHHPLGFVKNIGSRANNLYPDEWRIRFL